MPVNGGIFSFRTLLTIHFIAVLFLGIMILSVVCYFGGKRLLERATFDKLAAIRTIKAGQVVQYIDMLRDQCLSTSETTMIADAIRELRNGFNDLQASPEELAQYTQELQQFYGNEFIPKLNQTALSPYTVQDYFPLDEKTIIAQALYLAQNPHPIEKKADFARANTAHAYNSSHEKYHAIFRRYAKRIGIADIYLVDHEKGHVVYSLTKKVDFGTNLITGPFKDSGLGKSFIELQRTADEDFVKITDYQFYDPAYGVPVAFVSTPIFGEGKKIGALIFQFPIDTLNDIMTYNKGWVEVRLGQTGESFLMGKDRYMRTISRQYLENPVEYVKMLRDGGYDSNLLDKMQVYDTTVLLEKIRIATLKEALENKTNTIITMDINGKMMISTFQPIKIHDIEWYIFVEMNTEEAFAAINTLLWQIGLSGLLILILSTLVAFISMRRLTRPLLHITNMLGDEDRPLTQMITVYGSSEFVQLAQAYNRVVEHINNMLTKIHSMQEQVNDNNRMLQQEYANIQDSLNDIALINKQLLEQNKTNLTSSDNNASTQTLRSLTATIEQGIQSTIMLSIDMEKKLFLEQEKLLASTQGPKEYGLYLIEAKATIQNIVHALNSLAAATESLQKNYEQEMQTFTTIQTEDHEKMMRKVESIMTTNLEKLHTISTTYVELAQQLATLIKEFET